MEPLSKRVEVTLKKGNAGGPPKSESYDLKQFHVGDIISGRIKRVEAYGLFIEIDQTGMVKILFCVMLKFVNISNSMLLAKSFVGSNWTCQILIVIFLVLW